MDSICVDEPEERIFQTNSAEYDLFLPLTGVFPLFRQIAKKYHKTTAQILIRWGLQKNFIVIAKSTNLERMKTNLEVTTGAWAV